jgi:hypothetical protein
MYAGCWEVLAETQDSPAHVKDSGEGDLDLFACSIPQVFALGVGATEEAVVNRQCVVRTGVGNTGSGPVTRPDVVLASSASLCTRSIYCVATPSTPCSLGQFQLSLLASRIANSEL